MMIVAGPRGSGKTTALYEWLYQDSHNVMIVADETRRHHALSDYGRFIRGRTGSGISVRRDHQIVTVQWARENARLLGGSQFAVDDLDWIVSEFLGVHVQIATVQGCSTLSPWVSEERMIATRQSLELMVHGTK